MDPSNAASRVILSINRQGDLHIEKKSSSWLGRLVQHISALMTGKQLIEKMTPEKAEQLFDKVLKKASSNDPKHIQSAIRNLTVLDHAISHLKAQGTSYLPQKIFHSIVGLHSQRKDPNFGDFELLKQQMEEVSKKFFSENSRTKEDVQGYKKFLYFLLQTLDRAFDKDRVQQLYEKAHSGEENSQKARQDLKELFVMRSLISSYLDFPSSSFLKRTYEAHKDTERKIRDRTRNLSEAVPSKNKQHFGEFLLQQTGPKTDKDVQDRLAQWKGSSFALEDTNVEKIYDDLLGKNLRDTSGKPNKQGILNQIGADIARNLVTNEELTLQNTEIARDSHLDSLNTNMRNQGYGPWIDKKLQQYIPDEGLRTKVLCFLQQGGQEVTESLTYELLLNTASYNLKLMVGAATEEDPQRGRRAINVSDDGDTVKMTFSTFRAIRDASDMGKALQRIEMRTEIVLTKSGKREKAIYSIHLLDDPKKSDDVFTAKQE